MNFHAFLYNGNFTHSWFGRRHVATEKSGGDFDGVAPFGSFKQDLIYIKHL